MRLLEAVVETWRRVWGNGKFFSRTRISDWRFFGKNVPFWRPKILMIFLVIDQVFKIFPFFFQIHVVYDPFFTRKAQVQKRIPWRHFFYSVRTFARVRQHYFSKYWGDGCMGRPPTWHFWGTVPQAPLGLRLCPHHLPCISTYAWLYACPL